MGFKNILAVCGVLATFTLIGCGEGLQDGPNDDNVIGNRVEKISSLSSDESNVQVVMFDETVRRIHQFDANSMTLTRSFEVSNPEADHYVLYSQAGNYIIDMTLKGISIINKFGHVTKDPIRFQGKPRSAAFSPTLGYLIVYDELASVGFLKLDAQGDVVNSWVAGPSIFNGATISSGDLLTNGKLVLSMTDASIVIVNTEQVMIDKKWQVTNYEKFTTTLGAAKWVAPVRDASNQLMVCTEDKIALVDLTAKTVLSEVSYDDDSVKKMSKHRDPHVILQDGNFIKVVYAQNSTIQSKSVLKESSKFSIDNFLSSTLNLDSMDPEKEVWSFVDTRTSYSNVDIFDDLNSDRSERGFKRYRFSDLYASHNKVIPADAKVEISTDYIFALFPSKLGYAVRYEVDSEDKVEAKFFNRPYIRGN